MTKSQDKKAAQDVRIFTVRPFKSGAINLAAGADLVRGSMPGTVTLSFLNDALISGHLRAEKTDDGVALVLMRDFSSAGESAKASSHVFIGPAACAAPVESICKLLMRGHVSAESLTSPTK